MYSESDIIKKNALIFLLRQYRDIIIVKHNIINTMNIDKTDADHLIWMCETAIQNYDEYFKLDGDNSKVNRWLGYIQAMLIINKITTVDDERNNTRHLLTAHRNNT